VEETVALSKSMRRDLTEKILEKFEEAFVLPGFNFEVFEEALDEAFDEFDETLDEDE
jgi:hypothetical protein